MAKMLRMLKPGLATLMGKAALGRGKRCGAQHGAHLRVKARAQRGQIRGHARCRHGVIHRVRHKHLAHIGPEQVERGLHAVMALRGAVAQRDHRLGGALNMVLHLLDRLGRNRRDLGIGRCRQPGQHRQMPAVEQELAQDGLAEIAIGLLHQQHVAEVPDVAQHGKVIRAAALAFNLSRKAQPHLRLPDEVQRDIGQRDIFLQRRRVAAPFADPVAQHEGVVAHPAQKFEQLALVHLRHHMAPTSSGMSKKVGWR